MEYRTAFHMPKDDKRLVQPVVFVQCEEELSEVEELFNEDFDKLFAYLKEYDFYEECEPTLMVCELDAQCGRGVFVFNDDYIAFRQLGGLDFSFYRILKNGDQ